MKLHCTYSGMHYTLPDFPKATLKKPHPIFSAPQKTLLRASEEFLAGHSTPQETILLFLALASSTGLLIFRDPFDAGPVPEDAASLLAAHMEPLAVAVGQLYFLTDKGLDLPQVVCSRADNNNTARSLVRCVRIWREAITEYGRQAASASAARDLLRAEERLQRAHKMLKLRPTTYANTLAEWACTVGAFPENEVSTPRHARIPKAQWYKEIIRNCVLRNGKSLAQEISEVIDFCEENIPVEDYTIHAISLMDALRGEYRAKFNTLGYSISAPRASNIPLTRDEQEAKAKELELLRSIREAAPGTGSKPERSQFSTDFQFIRAMAAWRLAQTLDAAESTPSSPAQPVAAGDSPEGA